MQPPNVQELQSTQNPIHFPPMAHPKIKPLIRPYPRERYLNEENIKKSIISRKKTSTVITIRPDQCKPSSPRFIREYMELLKAQNSLSKLNYRGQDLIVFENAYISSQLKNLSLSISSLHLQIRSSSKPSFAFKVLLKRLRLLKNLTHMKITFLFFNSEDSKIFTRLFKSLLSFNKLKNLSLHFLMSGHAKGNQVDVITTYLQRLTQLRALQLHFNRYLNPPEDDTQNNDILNNLPFVFSKLTKLTKVYLSFAGRDEIRATALTELFKSLQHLKNLSDLTLNLPLAKISNQNNQVLSECLFYLNETSIRKLSFHPNTITECESLGQISQALGKFAALNILCINLYGCGATDQDLAHFSVALESMSSLSSVSFNFPLVLSSEMREFGIGKVVSALGSLPSLVNLRLDFANPGDLHVEQLATSIGKLTRLRFLDLCFAFRKSLSDTAIISLSGNLRKLVLLKDLSLNFAHCTDLSNTGIEAIVNTVKTFDFLSSLALDFSENPDIDENIVSKIGRIVQSRTSLYSLSLGVLSCTKLKEKEDSLLGLFRSLEEAGHIQDIFLKLPDQEMNKQEMARLKERKIVLFEIPEDYSYTMFEKMIFCLHNN